MPFPGSGFSVTTTEPELGVMPIYFSSTSTAARLTGRLTLLVDRGTRFNIMHGLLTGPRNQTDAHIIKFSAHLHTHSHTKITVFAPYPTPIVWRMG